MNKKLLAPLLMSAVLLVTGCSSKKEEKKVAAEPAATASFPAPVTQEGLDQITATWPDSSKAAIQGLTVKYGLPSSVSEEMVVWNNTAPFKRSIVYREEVNQLFPYQHADVLQQTVDYRVPLDKIDDLSKFDGSLLVDRTKGELSTRNEREEMNILSLNLANKIVKGEMTVEQARREYSKSADAFAAGTTSPMITNLAFGPQPNSSDPDTMMQSQETKEAPAFRKTIKQSEEVHEVIEE